MITSEDRAKYSYYTDESILGIKLIGGLEDQVLLDISYNHNDYFQAIRTLMGKTNPRWIIARVAEELYERDLIDEKRLDELMQ